MERLLRVTAPHFCASAVWVREADGWRCVRAAPILGWMMRQPADQTAAYMQRRGWSWEWL